MGMTCCCAREVTERIDLAMAPEGARPNAAAKLLRRVLRTIQWAAPAAALAMTPKCPACVAGYVAAVTGIGLSAAAAAQVRFALVWGCCALLALVVARRTFALRRSRSA